MLNMSFGSEGDSPLLRSVVQNAAQHGVLMVGAAGNEATAAPMFPAAYESVLAVTAGDRRGLAPYANYGTFVDAMAPGTSVVRFNGNTFFATGTSSASAYVAGFAAALRAQPGSSVQSVFSVIQQRLPVAPLPGH